MPIRDETILILAGGALLIGVIVHRKLTAAESTDATLPAVGWPSYPAVTPAVTPAGTPLVAPPLSTSPPPAASTPAPPPTPAQVNQAFATQEAAAHASQDQYYADQVAELKARVATGAVQVGSPYYVSAMAYLANLGGGVATAAAETAKLHAAGLAGPRRRPPLRLV